MARPRKKIDEELLAKLASIHCTMEEMASMVGVSKDTLERRYAAFIEENRGKGKARLRRIMWGAAMEGNPTMMIWLSKNLLGYTDKQEIQQTSADSKLVIQFDEKEESK
jgi:hypothetical protein